MSAPRGPEYCLSPPTSGPSSTAWRTARPRPGQDDENGAAATEPLGLTFDNGSRLLHATGPRPAARRSLALSLLPRSARPWAHGITPPACPHPPHRHPSTQELSAPPPGRRPAPPPLPPPALRPSALEGSSLSRLSCASAASPWPLRTQLSVASSGQFSQLRWRPGCPSLCPQQPRTLSPAAPSPPALRPLLPPPSSASSSPPWPHLGRRFLGNGTRPGPPSGGPCARPDTPSGGPSRSPRSPASTCSRCLDQGDVTPFIGHFRGHAGTAQGAARGLVPADAEWTDR